MVVAYKLRVLSLNTYTMGHITYQDGLENSFAAHAPDIDFHSLHLPEHMRRDLLGRVVYWLLSRRMPGVDKTDADYIRLRLELACSFYAARVLNKMIKRTQPEVLHVHTQSIALLSSRFLRSIPSVVSIDCTNAILSRIHPSPAHSTYQPLIRLEKECLTSSGHIITWSDVARKSVIEDYNIPHDKVTTIHPTVPGDLFFGMPRSLKTTKEKIRLLFVGNDFVRKGGEDLLAVFQERFAQTCELDLVTNWPLEEPKIPGVRLHRGLRPLSPQLLDLFAQADIFVLPTHEDAFPMVFVEAMAAGLPCIGTTVIGVPELVRNGVNGLTLHPGNRAELRQALEQLITSAEMRFFFGQAGRQIVNDDFGPAKNCQRIAQIFASVTGKVKITGG
jgi:alpha-maltose-1-phosphate synthase